MHTRSLLLLALSTCLLSGPTTFAQTPKALPAPGTVIPLGDADNGKSITLHHGDHLSVALDTNPSTAYSWNLLADPNSPLALTESPQYKPFPRKRGIVGSGGYTTYDFAVQQPASFARAFYLRFLSLRLFDKGIAGAKLWEIKVTIPAEPAAPKR